MKICWDNLENLVYIKNKNEWKKNSNIYIYMDSCKTCKNPYLTNKRIIGEFCDNSCSQKGRKFSKEHKEKISESLKRNNINENNPNWKGGVKKKNIPLYNTYAPQIEYAEQVKKSIEGYLEVKCAYCGKWYIPKTKNIENRINALDGKIQGEYRLYCSDECKQECPIYHKIKFSAEESNTKRYSREVQPELRQMVFERDNYTCQKCGSTKLLHCHHVEGIRHDPLESADIDKCITLCKECHKEVHRKEECGYKDMKCKENL